MTGIGPVEGGRTRWRPWGKPYGRHRVAEGLAQALIVIGVTVATWGLVTAALEVPEPGVSGDPPGGVVREVLPGGPAWHAGVREGQTVVGITTGETELDWVLQARGSGLDHYVTIRGVTAELRGTVPLAAASLLVALIATAAAFRRPRPAIATASLAGAVGTIPLVFGGHPVISSVGGVLMLGLPVAWLVAVGSRRRVLRLAVLAGTFTVAIAWLAARFAFPTLYEPVETVRVTASAAVALATVGLSLDRRALRAAVRSIDAPTALDLLGLAVAGGVALSLWLVAGVSPVLIAAVLVIVAIVYLRSRRPLVRALERSLLGERLERASVAAIEAERGRLAREIHDEPLQELSGLIKRLETNPAVSSEATALREVALHLRAVATDLQPPLLEDLGLGPAIAFLVEQANASGAGIRVEATVSDQTAIARTARLPPDVELAVFRIVQEAIANAQGHSGGTIAKIAGELTPDRIDLVVRDDGVGIDENAIREAQRRGRLGLTSMRQRAATIGAEFRVTTAGPAGTIVSVRWRRP